MNRDHPQSISQPASAAMAPARLQQILDALPHPVMLFTPHGQVDFANAEARRQFGEAGADGHCHYGHGAGSAAGGECPFNSVLASKQASISERACHDSDGQLRHVQITVAPLLDGDGNVDGLLETHHDVTRQRQEAQRLQLLQGHLLELAHRDALTNLANRRYLEMKLERLAAEHVPRVCAMLFADLDHFKPVNDVHGHIAGDAVLSTIANRLRQVLRGTDLLARIGGDEFAILLEGASESGARAVAGKIISALDEPLDMLPSPNQLGVSIGICLFKTGSELPADLLEHADRAMYRAKRRGGRQYDLQLL